MSACRFDAGAATGRKAMSDRDEIVEKINLYALAVDAQAWDLFDRIFIEKCDAD